ncbi:MAG: hypothetical protein MSG64_05990 [Pyrinomonadaceae bacterium MAG19_C2-C3]|nr:hypothetical protein [Pyrinomonadaceae bacterium MAG19_C2-C3]
MKQKIQVYAIVRLDEAYAGQNAVTVKSIVTKLDEAEREVVRLNQLNADKGARYFWQATRFSISLLTPELASFSSEENLSVNT